MERANYSGDGQSAQLSGHYEGAIPDGVANADKEQPAQGWPDVGNDSPCALLER